MLVVVLAILVKLVFILKLGLRSISKRIISLIFLNIYTPRQHALTHNSLCFICFKIIDKANSKFDLKIKEALYINWRKPKLNAQQNYVSPFHYSFCSPCSFLSSFVFLLLFLQFSFIYCFHHPYANYQYLLLS